MLHEPEWSKVAVMHESSDVMKLALSSVDRYIKALNCPVLSNTVVIIMFLDS